MQNPGRIVRSGERDAAIVKEVKLRLNEVLGLVGEVQNGSIGKIVKQRIQAKFCELPEGAAPEEKEVVRMTIIANVWAEAANPQWVGNVRSRRLCCANGSGSVHGIFYSLQDQFGIGLTRYSP